MKRLCVAASHIAPPKNPLSSSTKGKERKKKNLPNSKEKIRPPSKAAAHLSPCLSISSRVLVFPAPNRQHTEKPITCSSDPNRTSGTANLSTSTRISSFVHFLFLLRTTDNEEAARDTQASQHVVSFDKSTRGSGFSQWATLRYYPLAASCSPDPSLLFRKFSCCHAF